MAKRWLIGGLAVGVGALVVTPEARIWLRRRLGLEAEDRRWFEEEGAEAPEYEGDEPLDTREARFSLRARLSEDAPPEPDAAAAAEPIEAPEQEPAPEPAPFLSAVTPAARARARAASPRSRPSPNRSPSPRRRRSPRPRRPSSGRAPRSRRPSPSPRSPPSPSPRAGAGARAGVRAGVDAVLAPASRFRVRVLRVAAGDHARGRRTQDAGRGHRRGRPAARRGQLGDARRGAAPAADRAAPSSAAAHPALQQRRRELPLGHRCRARARARRGARGDARRGRPSPTRTPENRAASQTRQRAV